MTLSKQYLPVLMLLLFAGLTLCMGKGIADVDKLTQAEASLTLDEQTTINSFVGMVDLLKAPHHHE